MKTSSLRSIVLAVAVSALAACAGDATAPSSATLDPSLDNAGSANVTSARSAARIRLIASLTPIAGGGFGRASGKAKWDSRNNNSVRELQMEVEDVRPGTQVQFFVNGVQYGATVTVNGLGDARVSLGTQLGHTVPTAAAGLSAEVRTTGGNVVVRGVFPAS